jgi:heptose-I-phosphate ethanolaminephosphotransferase
MYKEISVIKLVKEYANYIKEVNLLNKVSQDKIHLKVTTNNVTSPETYIFIIGESTNKFHMQLYGYERETTPELQKLRDELVLFNNVKSSHVHTIESLKDVFVLKDKASNFTQNTLIDCFNKAGYSTFWLSNQSYLGENETPISAIANNSTQQVYINSSGSNSLDENLIPELKTILNKSIRKKVVFIHLMGTHLSYQDRYPAAYNVFKESNISIFGEHADSYINQYDNAILYNDYVVSEIIKTAKNINGLAAVTYFSDHGDEVYDFRNFHGHSGAMQSKYMTNVPMFFWANSPFLAQNSTLLVNAKNNINQPFSLKNFSHTAQDLFNVKSNYFQPEKSYFNIQDSLIVNIEPQQIPRPHKSPYAFDSKIWVHRVNSLERLTEVESLFKGMELDVVFENGKLDVRHPPAQTINLSFEKYLSNMKSPSDHYFWLDLKNLTPNNVSEIISHLNYLTQKFNIKRNILIETTSPATISKLNNAGYFTSYYLPYLAGLNEQTLSNEIVSINKNILLNQPVAISQNFDNYYILNEHFSTQNKLIWALNLNWNDPKTHNRIENLLLKDSTIKVCLVNFKTIGWR